MENSSEPAATHVLELNLLENGIDFIQRGIDELFVDTDFLREELGPTDLSSKNYKYGVLHLFSGFLLLLKERLRRHLPELVFKGRISDVREKLAKVHEKNQNEDSKLLVTVDFDEALERLEIGPLVTFDKAQIRTVRKIQDYRNTFEHYEVRFHKYELWKHITDFLNIVDKFLYVELQVEIESIPGSDELIAKIMRIKSAWQRIDERRRNEILDPLSQQRDEFFLRRDEALDELGAENYADKGAFVQFIECPDCSSETLIIAGDYAGVCCNEDCREFWPLTSCSICGGTAVGFPWSEWALCAGCSSYHRNLVDKD